MTVHQFEDNAAKGAQGYAINWDTAEARVKDLKAYLMNAPQVMDPERLQFLNEVYEEFQGTPILNGTWPGSRKKCRWPRWPLWVK